MESQVSVSTYVGEKPKRQCFNLVPQSLPLGFCFCNYMEGKGTIKFFLFLFSILFEKQWDWQGARSPIRWLTPHQFYIGRAGPGQARIPEFNPLLTWVITRVFQVHVRRKNTTENGDLETSNLIEDGDNPSSILTTFPNYQNPYILNSILPACHPITCKLGENCC